MAALEATAPKPSLARQLSILHGSGDLQLFLNTFKPLTEKNAEGKKALARAWRTADPNGNRICSLAELDRFVKAALIAKHGPAKGAALWKLFRPSTICAFNDAKDYKKDDGKDVTGAGSTADDFVSPGEFRLFCAYSVVYAAMYDGFSKVDGYGEGKEGDDRRVSLDEWLAGYNGLKDYGFVAFEGIADDETATAVFHAIDSNGGGFVMLDEYCAYVKEKEIENKTLLGDMLNAEE